MFRYDIKSSSSLLNCQYFIRTNSVVAVANNRISKMLPFTEEVRLGFTLLWLNLIMNHFYVSHKWYLSEKMKASPGLNNWRLN